MKLIVGLGNPGEKYKANRHNVGHMVVDRLEEEPLPKGMVVSKTDSFMNDSGTAVQKLVRTHSVKPSDLYVVHDDLDIKLGDYKIQFGKGPKVHGGIGSIELALGTSDFWRVRVGVDNRLPDNRQTGEKYVLDDFTEEEGVILETVIKKVIEELRR